MSDTVISGVNLKAMGNRKSNPIENMFSKYKKKQMNDETLQQKDKVSIGEMIKEAVDNIFDPTTGMTDKQKEEFINEINRKIRNGEKLTADEMQYLRINDPLQYAKVARVQMKRQMLENRLKACKSKEEAQEVFTDAMSRISDDDPDRAETMAAYNNAYEEFRKADGYEDLPNTKEEAEKKENKR